VCVIKAQTMSCKVAGYACLHASLHACVYVCVRVCVSMSLCQLFSVNSAAFVCAPSCGSVDKPTYCAPRKRLAFHISRKSELHLPLHTLKGWLNFSFGGIVLRACLDNCPKIIYILWSLNLEAFI